MVVVVDERSKPEHIQAMLLLFHFVIKFWWVFFWGGGGGGLRSPAISLGFTTFG